MEPKQEVVAGCFYRKAVVFEGGKLATESLGIFHDALSNSPPKLGGVAERSEAGVVPKRET